MKPLRILATVAVLALGAAAIWFAGTQRGQRTDSTAGAEARQVAYDFEARDVVVRQMGPDGRLQYQIEARAITQEPDSGRVEAVDLTLLQDPIGTEPGGPYRWTLTADTAELPAQGNVITMAGNVQATGRPEGSKADLTVAAQRLAYNLDTQDVTSDTDVQLTWGANRLSGSALRANVRTGSVALESRIHGTLSP